MRPAGLLVLLVAALVLGEAAAGAAVEIDEVRERAAADARRAPTHARAPVAPRRCLAAKM
jgi:hypothetical protein